MGREQMRIQLTGDYLLEEADAGVAGILPGMLLRVTNDETVSPHATQGGWAERAFAVEDALQGNGIDDAYADEEKVIFHMQRRGNRVNAIIRAGENLEVGDLLVSAGDGTLIDGSSVGSGVDVADIIAVAVEEIDLSASGAVNTLAAVRIL